jgi:hypothetical protein
MTPGGHSLLKASDEAEGRPTDGWVFPFPCATVRGVMHPQI